MRVNNQHFRSIWYTEDSDQVHIIDQTCLPYKFKTLVLETLEDAARAIQTMEVRGAPLIGATAAFGVYLAMKSDGSDASLTATIETLIQTRPTAINLKWALDRVHSALLNTDVSQRMEKSLSLALEITDEDVEINRKIGVNFADIIQQTALNNPGRPINLLTHCNAGWLATVDWGTALSGIFQAHDAGIDLHVYVDETRPRNQGALSAWELASHGVKHTVVVDNAGGFLMQQGLVDLVIVGTDRTSANGDVCNKIGTYLKALAAQANNIPFYVALPSPTIDWTRSSGHDIPIEQRAEDEIRSIQGLSHGTLQTVEVYPVSTPVSNPAFDVTPAALVTGLVTERGICKAHELASLFPEMGV